MTRIVLKIDGMGCGMCEAHVNDAVRAAFAPKKVTSSHEKGETVILSHDPLDEALLRRVVETAGYRVEGVTQEPYEKKGLFGKVK
ncbi:MAG: heavy-metal-associated domain-containing protein [Clostridia bacterium]|nr:heavy-metal-associated domain-containing protein [Clostridia bacterium]